jgi:hypothetical protein
MPEAFYHMKKKWNTNKKRRDLRGLGGQKSKLFLRRRRRRRRRRRPISTLIG